MSLFENITKTVGNTPLVKMQRLGAGLGAEILLKLEFFNPLGSVKDRIGLNMVETAERDGTLKAGMTIVEPTSGNTGISLAFVAAAKGYKLILTMPETMSLERRTLLLLLGAEVVLTPAALGMKGAIAKSIEIASKTPNSFMPKQFENPANPKIHELTTALEIWQDTQGRVDRVVSGVGTGGTFTGIARVLKSKKPSLKMIAVEPEESAVISGAKPAPHKIQGIGAGFIPKNFDKSFLDHVEKVSSVEALKTAKRVIKEEGIPVGISSGAAIAAALRQAALPEARGQCIVVIVPSYSERYLSTLLAEEERVLAQGLTAQEVSQEWIDKV